MTAKSPRRIIPIKAEKPSTLSAEQRSAIQKVCAANKDRPGALMPILHAVQDELAFVPADAVPIIAAELNLSMAEVHGVVTFYHYFRKDAPGRHVVHLCRAEACQAVGSAVLEAHAKNALGIDFHGTTSDGAVSLEPVYCLGNCALGPSIMIDDKLQGRVSTQRFDALIAACRAGSLHPFRPEDAS